MDLFQVFDADIHMSHTRFDVSIRLLSCVFVFPSSFKCVKATFVTPSVTFHLHSDTQRWTTLVRLDPGSTPLDETTPTPGWTWLAHFPELWERKTRWMIGAPLSRCLRCSAACRMQTTRNFEFEARGMHLPADPKSRSRIASAWPLSLEFGTVNDFNGFVVKMLLLSPCVVTFVRLGSELMQVSKSFERFELWTFGNCQHVLIKTFFRVCNWSYKDKYKN